jgi:ketosteroid isomerase-like protein
MKKIVFLLILAFTSLLTVKAQKENGTVYSEHDAINKIKAMWASFVKGDKETFVSFFADTIWVGSNGDYEKKPQKYMGGFVDWWKNFDNFDIQDDKPAFPDAIKYKNGDVWVQDWLLWTGTHRATGIKIKLHVHNLYRFNKDGKIAIANEYFNNDIFDYIEKSQKTLESGVVYKYHPYINIARKSVNAYAAKDIETLFAFYTPDAVFGSLSLKDGETIDLKAKKAETQKNFAYYNTIELVQSGEPVCVAYEKEYYVVYSWWVLSVSTKDGRKISNIPVMITQGFDNNGKIKWESDYLDSNRFK